MVIKFNKKLAFTLAESLICLALIGIIVAASMKIFTQKHKKIIYNPTHGYFMCYVGEDGNTYQKTGAQTPVLVAPDAEGNTYCKFNPKKVANFYVIYAVGGGGGGGSTNGGNPGNFTSVFTTSIAEALRIFPGAAGAANEAGGDTVIMNGNGEVLTSIFGGLPNGIRAIDKRFVRKCEAVPMPDYIKNTEAVFRSVELPTCEPNDSQIDVKLCTDETDINQHDYIETFFNDFMTASNNTWSNSSDFSISPWWSYDYASNSLWYNHTINEGTQSFTTPFWWSSTLRYDGNEHKLYKNNGSSYSPYLSGLSSSGETPCVTGKLVYSSDIVLDASIDKGDTIIRTINSGGKPYFKVFITLNKAIGTLVNAGVNALPSELPDYLTSSGLNNSNTQPMIVDGGSGMGGAKGEAGHAGAVLISW